jgi:hypothetical protein
MAEFTNNSLNVTLPQPDLILTELSTHVDYVSSGTVEGSNVAGIAFNQLPATSLTGTMVTLSAVAGLKFSVDSAYNNQTLGVILENRKVCIFQALTAKGQTARQSLTASSFDHSYPELRRLKTLGML